MRKRESIWSSSSCDRRLASPRLQAGEVDYSAAGGLSVRAAMKGVAAENDHVHSDPAKLQPHRPAGNDTRKN